MIDHILDHLHLADEYAANAARIKGLKSRSKRLGEVRRRCSDAAEREHTASINHATQYDIDPLVVMQEYATWRRLRKYSLDSLETLTVADLRWLRIVIRYGRPTSRNVRRATELLFGVEAVLDQNSGQANQGRRARSTRN